MKSGQLFWGFLFVTIGALILLNKFDLIYFDWFVVWDLWPVLLILGGILILARRSILKPVLAILLGVAAGAAVYGIFSSPFHYRDNNRTYYMDWDNDRESYRVDYDSSIKNAELTLKAGAGTFVIRRTSGDLLSGYARGSFTDYKFRSVINDDTAKLIFENKDNSINIFDDEVDNRLELRLNENPVWDMDLAIGAAKAIFELDDFKIRDLKLKSGATDIDLKLGDKSPRTNVDIKMGAANLEIRIPHESGCRVTSETFLLGKTLDGFTETRNGNYETSNFDSADKRIIIRVKGAVANLEIKRY